MIQKRNLFDVVKGIEQPFFCPYVSVTLSIKQNVIGYSFKCLIQWQLKLLFY